ncbi:ester cyclase [Scytonema sp. UIC 10036]|uniref:nuclear transport factor 2 family protein n=1 Tax=Scytonema sp. UIC 10036 TaxID=2304196 RepID=UPI00140F6642|nr:ester cyclase [Scytonema sp. UIC 10036]
MKLDDSKSVCVDEAKKVVWQVLLELPGRQHGASAVSNLFATLSTFFSHDCKWHVAHPVNEVLGSDILPKLWQPLLSAMPDLDRRSDIFIGNTSRIEDCETVWVAVTGHYVGTFQRSLFGISPTLQAATLRFGEFYRMEGSRIVECYVLLDFIDLMRQANCFVLPPSRGIEGLSPGPQFHDGLLRTVSPLHETEASLELVEAMIFGGLSRFDGADIRSMGMELYWHPHMMWYGPSGIGTARGIEGFEGNHQRPFLHAFPDRQGGNHRARIADGKFVASTGWPSVYATHRGEYLGVSATNRPVTMRVMDWWRREKSLLIENWVFIDIPHLMLQMDVDLFER